MIGPARKKQERSASVRVSRLSLRDFWAKPSGGIFRSSLWLGNMLFSRQAAHERWGQPATVES